MDIKYIREQKFLTRQEFAKLIGVSHATVSYWEKGQKGISPKMQSKISEFCAKNNLKTDDEIPIIILKSILECMNEISNKINNIIIK